MLHCTLKHVHHAEEGQGERGFAAARPATDPHLKTNESESPTFKSRMKSIFWHSRFVSPLHTVWLPSAQG